MMIDWEPLRRIIDDNRRIVLTCHVRPDADALGSELGLAAILEERGKEVRFANPSETPEHLRFLDPTGRLVKFGHGISAEEVCAADVHIVLDTSAWVQLQDVGPLFERTPAVRVVIDHHVSADDLKAVEFKDVEAEATGSLIVRMADALGWEIPERAVTPLFCAIATDTGWFRFSSTTADTMRQAAQLIDRGAQPHLIYQWLHERNSAARMRLHGRVLSRLNLDCEGRLAWVSVTREDFDQTGARPAETEDLVNECLRIEGTECGFIAIQQLNGNVKVSFRSRTSLDVAAIAEQFGGGGHRQASGAILPGPLATALERVLTAMRAELAGEK
ncbi:MAG: bifunctional oligoribonuclease/PAP phosphatase NrnA [Planctomycetes bacterium]|nr:bifunctional oligoribonuclease/PAP phosphatase NrnA [Planctomycetota bacterium]